MAHSPTTKQTWFICKEDNHLPLERALFLSYQAQDGTIYSTSTYNEPCSSSSDLTNKGFLPDLHTREELIPIKEMTAKVFWPNLTRGL